MNANTFRKLALSFPEAVEQSHMGHPDFRVRGKIFATLWADDKWGMVKLTPSQQESFVSDEPEAFHPVNGAWGRGGATKVCLPAVKEVSIRRALEAAWRNTAPKRLADRYDE